MPRISNNKSQSWELMDMSGFKIVEFNCWRIFTLLVLIQAIPYTYGRIAGTVILGILFYWALRKNKSSVSVLYSLALKDELTGLYNYRYFCRRVKEEIERVNRFGGTLSLLLIDVDYFKSFNDQYGHEYGNKALKELAGIFLNCTRTVDVVARFGGDEFVVICPNTDAAQAKTVAERIRQRAADSVFRRFYGELTVSIGVVQYRGEGFDRFIERADKRLYKSKASGRNTVYVS